MTNSPKHTHTHRHIKYRTTSTLLFTYLNTVFALYTLTHTSHLSFGSAAGPHRSSVQPAASCSLPNRHCGYHRWTHLHTHTILENQEWWCTTNHSECVQSLCLPSPPSIPFLLSANFFSGFLSPVLYFYTASLSLLSISFFLLL